MLLKDKYATEEADNMSRRSGSLLSMKTEGSGRYIMKHIIPPEQVELLAGWYRARARHQLVTGTRVRCIRLKRHYPYVTVKPSSGCPTGDQMTINHIAAMALTISLYCYAGATSLLIAQSAQERRPQSTDVFPGQGASEQEPPGLPDEMRSRLRIEREESAHKKILESAKEVGELSLEVHRSFRERGKLSSDDLKKLSTIEKLAKRVLSHAGGEEFEAKKDSSTEQLTLSDAVNQLVIAGSQIKEKVTVETRFVVSMAVIEASNEVIRLAQYVRRAQK